jgi:hypothetical protein
MKNIMKITIFVLGIIFSNIAYLQSQNCYQSFFDASGVQLSQQELAVLENTACRLIDSMPLVYQDSFKVFDIGFYLLNEVTSGYPAAFQKAIEQAKATSKYYLLFGRQTDKLGINTKFWVDLRLPESDIFNCLDTVSTFRDKISVKYDLIANVIHKKNNKISQLYPLAEIGTIDSLINFIAKTRVCCYVSGQKRDPNCSTNCIFTDEQIKADLLSKGFVGLPIGVTIAGFQSFNQYDYSRATFNGTNMAQLLNQVTNGLNGEQVRTFVTDNQNYCLSNDFDKVLVDYNTNLEDFDVWFHIYQTESQTLLFCKFDWYFWADDPTLAALTAAKQKISNKFTEDKVIILDPSINKFYLSDDVSPLPQSADYNDSESEQEFHIVTAGQNNFEKIVEYFDYEFTKSDLIRWNPTFDDYHQSHLSVGDKILLFYEDYLEFNNSNTYGINIPYRQGAGSDYWAHFNFCISKNNLRNQLNSTFHSDAFVQTLVNSPTIVKGFPLANDAQIPTSIGALVLDIPTPYSGTQKYVKLFDVTLPEISSTLVSGAFIILALVLEPTSFGSSDQPVTFPHISFPYEFDPGGRVETEPEPVPQPNPDPEGPYIPFTPIRVPKGNLKYVTYTKSKPSFVHWYNPSLKNGRVYIGRSKGYGKPDEIVRDRDYGHSKLNGESYSAAKLDSWTVATQVHPLRYGDIAYLFIRGRENKVIKDMNGPLGKGSLTGEPDSYKAPINDKTRSRNKIPGMSTTGFLVKYISSISHSLPEKIIEEIESLSLVHPIQAYPDWDGQ